MYQKDYILRMVEMLADLLAAIFGMIRKGNYQQAEENLERIYYDMLKEDASFFRSIPADELTHKLLDEHNYSSGHLEILAELFNAEAELDLAQGNNDDCIRYSEKALLLFEYIDTQERTLSLERLNKMNKIQERIHILRNEKALK